MEVIKAGQIATGSESNDTERVQATRALLKLLIDARRRRFTEKDFISQLKLLTEFTDDRASALAKFLSEPGILDELITSEDLRFRDLEWRVEAKVSTLKVPAD